MEERGALRKFNHSESSSRPPLLPNAVASSSLSSFQQLVAYVRADAPGRRRRGKKRGKVEFLLFPFPPSLPPSPIRRSSSPGISPRLFPPPLLHFGNFYSGKRIALIIPLLLLLPHPLHSLPSPAYIDAFAPGYKSPLPFPPFPLAPALIDHLLPFPTLTILVPFIIRRRWWWWWRGKGNAAKQADRPTFVGRPKADASSPPPCSAVGGGGENRGK